jgi:D-alanine--poly(phosphoribitol) ligase subunit 1
MQHLWDLIERAEQAAPDATALEVPEGAYTYAQLAGAARSLSEDLRGTTGPFIGLFASRSFGSYAGLLGIVHAGKGYVPLNPQLPTERLERMATGAQLTVLVADAAHAEAARAFAQGLDPAPQVLVAGTGTCLPAGRMPAPAYRQAGPAPPLAGPYAYMLFTSGSTGVPKGVPIGHRPVLAYVAHMATLLGARPGDRFTQLFDLSFDLSVHDLFVCWSVGGTLLVPGREQLMAPARYVKERRAQHWFGTPSTALLLHRLRLLKPDTFPDLRTVSFCGEALPTDLARAFQAAAPNAQVFNLYGPTEATIAITAYPLPASDLKERRGIVSIGRPFPGASALVSADGELLLGGPQLAEGYWQDPERSAKAFIVPAGEEALHYRTGDRVERDADGELHFVERLDDQVKVRGQRVELQEVAHVLRGIGGATFVEVLAFPVEAGIALGLHAFLPKELEARAAELNSACAAQLPEAARPTLHFIDALPVNTSGKTERQALRALLGKPTA